MAAATSALLQLSTAFSASQNLAGECSTWGGVVGTPKPGQSQHISPQGLLCYFEQFLSQDSHSSSL
jgi:hypothetical protein